MNSEDPSLAGLFQQSIGRIVPRILTQVSRDPNAPTFGSFDRNWWHYKIRDFSSVILQQGGYALAQAAELPAWSDHRDALVDLARGSARFWNARAQRKGAFEEYYPWEQGYPPVAFSSLAVAKLVRDGAVPLAEVRAGLRIAARQLGARFEAQAGNQQIAGLAALGVMGAIDPGLLDSIDFDALARRSLALQHDEGWYEEYDGPDLGYLAVTIDCLWDLYDVSGEPRFLDSATSALRFLDRMVYWSDGSVGMLNARNTDYVVPYGIARFRKSKDQDLRSAADRLLRTLFHDLDSPTHFLAAIDDRYLCHYVGHSFIRALPLLTDDTITDPHGHQAGTVLPGCGYMLATVGSGRLIVAGRKGGVLSWQDRERRVADFGWLVVDGHRQLFNHWWSADWQVEPGDDGMTVSGALFTHRSAISSPTKHAVLRVISYLFGARIIAALKARLIFKNDSSEVRFVRTITWSDSYIRVTDKFEGVNPGMEFRRAPRASKRHVSSADSFHIEDLSLTKDIAIEEEQEWVDGHLLIRTRYEWGAALQA